MRIVIARAFELPQEQLQSLLEESLREGFHSLVRLFHEWDSGENRFDHLGEALFLASAAGELVGICELNRDPYTSDPSVSRLRHLYVRSSHRRLGVGRLLTCAVLAHAAFV